MLESIAESLYNQIRGNSMFPPPEEEEDQQEQEGEEERPLEQSFHSQSIKLED